ncbi:MAG: two-component sensor histidine kinase [Hyphomonadaceae bacterium]|nr:two-component sensor histidine kinase [Hyphomonadaceae bacterium]
MSRAQEIWLRLGERFEPAVARLLARRAELAVAAALTAIFVIAGGLSPRVATLGLMAAAVLAAWWPNDSGTGGARALAQTATDGDRLWRMVIDAVPEPAVALNSHGQIVHANPQAEEQFRARRGGHLASMSRAPELLAAVEDALQLRRACAVELQARVPVERRLLATVVPLEHAGAAPGTPTLMITFRDLTEQDRLARMRADFVANASHELRTPLASLKGYVETLQGSAKDDAAARERFLKIMSEQAERMSRLVDDLLSLSRVEMREYLPLSEEADLGSVLTEVAQTLEPLARRAGVTLTLSRSDEEAVVRGDRDELMQVFQNLVQNAIKYGRSGGKVEMRLTREAAASGRPERYRVDVTDDGPGIAPQHLPRLTERFYRVNVAASREKGGTGLGLAIVKHILNRHRGELAITSKLGHGSTFSVLLPSAPDQVVHS